MADYIPKDACLWLISLSRTTISFSKVVISFISSFPRAPNLLFSNWPRRPGLLRDWNEIPRNLFLLGIIHIPHRSWFSLLRHDGWRSSVECGNACTASKASELQTQFTLWAVDRLTRWIIAHENWKTDEVLKRERPISYHDQLSWVRQGMTTEKLLMSVNYCRLLLFRFSLECMRTSCI